MQTKYRNCHNLRPTPLLIVSLKNITDDVLERAAGILILGYLRLLIEHRRGLRGKLHTLARS